MFLEKTNDERGEEETGGAAPSGVESDAVRAGGEEL